MVNPYIALLFLFLLIGLGVWLFRPEKGLFWQWNRARSLNQRVMEEDALKHLHRCERYGRPATVDSLAGALHITADSAADLLVDLEENELIRTERETFRLTAEGREYALHIIRSHRLWERYLADETGYENESWHDRAELAEHSLTPEETDELAANLGYPTHDPHGDPIPTSDGEMVPHGGQPLNTLAVDEPGRIVHLEDEPEASYAQLIAEGLSLGMVVRIIESSPSRLRFWADGEEHLLAPVVAANISVIPLPAVEMEMEPGEKLSSLEPGQSGEVLSISKRSHGSERRRFLDLGILPGTLISAEMNSPSGDPTAYRVREALLALRKEQADMIRIKRIPNG
ncbi:MAG: iron dependent repressor, metal binding and dimerization domain protein [Candidatus Promineifilaceae bacterium]|jgi:DtxR family Mn-dependent transcriptional regulator